MAVKQRRTLIWLGVAVLVLGGLAAVIVQRETLVAKGFAWYWHERHGNRVELGGAALYVPSAWWVLDAGRGILLKTYCKDRDAAFRGLLVTQARDLTTRDGIDALLDKGLVVDERRSEIETPPEQIRVAGRPYYRAVLRFPGTVRRVVIWVSLERGLAFYADRATPAFEKMCAEILAGVS